MHQSFNLGDIQFYVFSSMPVLLVLHPRIQGQIPGHEDWPL